MSDFAVVIPARFASVRLPGKPLRDILGKPMIQHVYERAIASSAVEVVIATDDRRIADVAEGFGATVCMTSAKHNSGSERIAEVCDRLGWSDDRVVVNLQGDEPTMPPELIDQCAALLDDPSADIGTLASPIASREDLDNPNVVKAVADAAGNAIYFRRALVSPDDAAVALHHHGIYAYRCGVLRRLVAAEPCDLELSERLEQLRALHLGMTIRIAMPVVRPGAGVDTEQDLAQAARSLRLRT
ncbi:MAG: 3-deoxy-manno-octulosonate cytidylyltransferase [Gammaproteobacteria bacterium]|nr:3-deoxy-manno-octulosonate cytidylyltransferase [Gammaproteobacteria bacterium]MDH5303238.1 3-deoxy-manno-octulosonate cytidylyltransferase [Gammaproteobacteria bacterium]MDH5322552.1 3-deoxy-manno-octulosonate cytidylyltransferase [Gammaproteobacteria bacterium]